MATILHTKAKSSRGLQILGFAGEKPPGEAGSSNRVKGLRPPKIARPDGIGPRERDLLTEGMDYMRERGPGLFVSIANGRGPNAEPVVRRLTRKVRSDIAQRQKRTRMRVRPALTVFEALGRDGLPKFNAHIVAVLPSAAERDAVVTSLNGSMAYARFGDEVSVVAEPVTEWSGLATYLLKEASSQARYKRTFRYIGGSIRLGELGGNRVNPSGDLRAALERRGLIEPYSRTNAKRRPRAPAFLAEIEVRYRDSLFAETLPVLVAPPRPKLKPVKRHKIEPISLPMNYAPFISEMLARLGPTHEAAGERVGVSRPQVTNIINHQFGSSRRVARRVLELAKAAA